MFDLMSRHSFVFILLAIFLEEMGIPMPIPTDIMIVFAGVEGARSTLRLLLWFGVLNVASAIGASVLYTIVWRGGRPLVDRFGRYVHLGPAQLARGEAFLQRRGWTGIAIGRAIPGLRYVTVIACGLLHIPYFRFITAHMVGSSVYIAVFLFLGAHFGPAVIEQIHAPEQVLRLLWLLVLAIGLPLLMMWLYYRGHAHRPDEPSRWRVVSAIVVSSLIGTMSMAGTWSTAADIAHLMNPERQLNITIALVSWFQGRGLPVVNAYTLVYIALMLVCAFVTLVYYDFILPYIAPRGAAIRWQVLGLIALAAAVVASFLIPSLLYPHPGPLNRWWRDGGYLFLTIVALGLTSYALTTVYGRALAIAVLPSLRRRPLVRHATSVNGYKTRNPQDTTAVESPGANGVEHVSTNGTSASASVPVGEDQG